MRGNSEHITSLLSGGSGPHFSCSSESLPCCFFPLSKTECVRASLKNTKQTKIPIDAEAPTLQHPHPGNSPSTLLPRSRGWGRQPQIGEMGANSTCKARLRLLGFAPVIPSVLSWQAEAEPLSQRCELCSYTRLCAARSSHPAQGPGSSSPSARCLGIV